MGVVHIGGAYRSGGKCMDFEAIMLFTQQVFHLQSYIILFDMWDCYYFKLILSLWCCKSVACKKTCNVQEEITFPRKLIFVFIPCFVGATLPKKFQKLRKKDIKETGKLDHRPLFNDLYYETILVWGLVSIWSANATYVPKHHVS